MTDACSYKLGISYHHSTEQAMPASEGAGGGCVSPSLLSWGPRRWATGCSLQRCQPMIRLQCCAVPNASSWQWTVFGSCPLSRIAPGSFLSSVFWIRVQHCPPREVRPDLCACLHPWLPLHQYFVFRCLSVCLHLSHFPHVPACLPACQSHLRQQLKDEQQSHLQRVKEGAEAVLAGQYRWVWGWQHSAQGATVDSA